MGSSEEELQELAKDLGFSSIFLGTFDKRFPGFIRPKHRACAIVNTGVREKGGVHWLALAWNPPNQTFFLFDPFGFSDAKLKQIYEFEYEGLLKRSALASTPNHCLQLVKSTESVQGPNSAACGLFCCMFLQAFMHWPDSPMDNNPTMNLLTGLPNKLLLLPQAQPIFKRNQETLYAFLAKRSPYFRRHQRLIEERTAFDYATVARKRTVSV